MPEENPWTKAREVNAIHKRLMASHPHKEDRTPEEEVAWDENIALYEAALGITLARRSDGEVDFPFRRVE